MGLATISVYHDARRKKQGEKCPVKIRVYYRNQTRYYNTGINLTESDFQSSFINPKPKTQEHKSVKIKLQILLTKANQTAEKIEMFSFEQFEKKFLRASGSGKDIFYYYGRIIELCKKEGRFSTASNYEQSQLSIEKFIAEKRRVSGRLNFHAITEAFLNDYETWMAKEDRSTSTVGIYLRPVRALFNLAIKEGEIGEELYPFGKHQYQIPASRNIKKSLKKEELKKLFEYVATSGSHIEKARDFWFFSYCCNGMNIKDIAELKWKNLSEDTISFYRSKTKNKTRSNQVPVVVPVIDFVRNVIEKYGSTDRSKDNYIFSILANGMDAEEKLRRVKAFTRFINQHMKTLGILLEITPPTTYFARHSFTSSAIRNGASMEFIQESLGHTSMATTMNYWAGFEDSVKRDVAEKLLNF